MDELFDDPELEDEADAAIFQIFDELGGELTVLVCWQMHIGSLSLYTTVETASKMGSVPQHAPAVQHQEMTQKKDDDLIQRLAALK